MDLLDLDPSTKRCPPGRTGLDPPDDAEEGKPSMAQEAAGALVESGRRLREAETAFREARGLTTR